MNKKKKIILLYQMGKVASRTVKTSMEKAGYKVWGPHSIMRPLTTQLFSYKQKYKFIGIKSKIKHLIDILYDFKCYILAKKRKPLKIVTIVREPISRNMSLFFQTIHIPLMHITSTSNVTKVENYTIERFQYEFFTNFNSSHGINWFDNELKRYFGLDVYKYEFNKEKGYEIIKEKNIELLIIKMENLNKIGSESLNQFLGEQSIELLNSNMAEKKWYSCVYKEFMNSIEFSNEYINNLYNSKFMKHFYTDEEIIGYKKKFSSQLGGDNV